MASHRGLSALKGHLRRFAAVQALRAGRAESALDLFAKAAKAHPADPRIHLGLADAKRAQGRAHEARRHVEVALRISPHDGKAHDKLAHLLMELGEPDAAEWHAWKALSLDPNLPKPVLVDLLRRRPDGEALLALHDTLRSLSRASTQDYGAYGFYQGFWKLRLPGQRPVEARLESYRLPDMLDGSMDALDIGCNCGFLSLSIAPHVRSVTGVEIDPRMVEVARHAATHLGQQNATFQQGAFKDFLAQSQAAGQRFDVVIATAVHMHVGLDIAAFGAAVAELLRPGGLVLLESQDIRLIDWDFADKMRRFAGSLFTVASTGDSVDENGIPRLHAILKLQ